MTGWAYAGAVAWIAWLASASGCESAAEPPDVDWWRDGSGGGGASTALLEVLDVEGLNCPAQYVSDMSCQFMDDGVRIVVGREHETGDTITSLLSVFFDGIERATAMTPEGGYIRTSWLRCLEGASTVGAPDPCELELQGIERGVPAQRAVATGGAEGNAIVEVGSRVRLRVSCPGGLYYPGSDDVNAFVVPITPSEFALEAQDCVVIE